MVELERITNEVVTREGCRLYDLDFRGRALRVFIDKIEGSISVEDCEKVSKGLSLQLDVEDLIPGGSYQLEVSSPGLERTLRRPWHYSKSVGQKIMLQLKRPLEQFAEDVKNGKGKKIIGQLVSVEVDFIELNVNDHKITIPFSEIDKAQTIFDFKDNMKGRK